jgi:hypothetical protein
MKKEIISSPVVSTLASILRDNVFLFRKIRPKLGHISEVPTQTPVRTSPRECQISNITMLWTSESDIDITEPVTYYRQAAVGSRLFFAPGSHDVYNAVTVQEGLTPQGKDSLASEERSCYTFERIRSYPPGAETASPNSTREPRRDEELEQWITSLFMVSSDEEFENGTISSFSHHLCSNIDRHGNAAMEIISYLFLYKNVNPEVLSEALRWLGRIDQVESHSYRLWLLERSLESPSIFVRDGAILGIAALDDPYAMPALRKAIEKETCEELRENMQAVLEQLEETAKCL